MKSILILTILLLTLGSMAQTSDQEKAEELYAQYKTIYRNDNSTKSEIKEALPLLISATELMPGIYKYSYALAAGYKYIGDYTNARDWYAKSKSKTTDAGQIKQLDNMISYCDTKINEQKLQERIRQGAGINIAMILKEGTNELDEELVNNLPKVLPQVNINNPADELSTYISGKISVEDFYSDEEFLVVSLSTQRGAEEHYQKGVKPFAGYFKNKFNFAKPQQYLTILLTENPFDLIEATNSLYPTAHLKAYAPFLGYYNEKDNLIAATGGRQGYGTVLHELIHAYLHSDYPDCPIWLNEGLATLYERTEWRNHELKSIPNWRFDRMDAEDFVTLNQLVSDINEHRYHLAQIRMLLLYFDNRSDISEFYSFAKSSGGFFTYDDLLARFDISEEKWQEFIKTTIDEYKTELYAARGTLGNPSEVKYIQQALNALLQSGLEVDGIWGPGSSDALVEFQKKYGLDPDGVYGPGTKKALEKEYAKLSMN
ncbi:peptidoglycan-binding protein [Maribellus mangrovi]|uniref:peptidoglycan-binding protein n=1 Tax=Maribellus mangrovi TaxID=3133146 RepID=UPI0030EF635F